jgi:hypothetical protein
MGTDFEAEKTCANVFSPIPFYRYMDEITTEPIKIGKIERKCRFSMKNSKKIKVLGIGTDFGAEITCANVFSPIFSYVQVFLALFPAEGIEKTWLKFIYPDMGDFGFIDVRNDSFSVGAHRTLKVRWH